MTSASPTGTRSQPRPLSLLDRGLMLAVAAAACLAIPFFVTLTSARLVISSDLLYSWGFSSFGIAASTGIDDEGLMEVSRDIRRYFEDDRERLDTVVVRDGRSAALFNEREILHMVDVKAIMQAVYRVQSISSLILAGAAAVAIVHRPSRRALAAGMVLGIGGLLVVVVVALIGAATSFEALFLQFHLLSFDNDLWLLDPRTDYLIRLFPQGFFLGATVAIGVVTLLLSVLLGVFAWRAARQA